MTNEQTRDFKCDYLRGKIIGRATEIELKLDLVISSYFCKNNFKLRREMLFFILSKKEMNFGFKAEIVTYILEHKYPQLLESEIKTEKRTYIHKKTKKEVEKDFIVKSKNSFYKNLEEIISTRNAVAHKKFLEHIYDEKKNFEDAISLQSWHANNGELKVVNDVYDSARIIDFDSKITSVTSKLMEVIKLINAKSRIKKK